MEKRCFIIQKKPESKEETYYYSFITPTKSTLIEHMNQLQLSSLETDNIRFTGGTILPEVEHWFRVRIKGTSPPAFHIREYIKQPQPNSSHLIYCVCQTKVSFMKNGVEVSSHIPTFYGKCSNYGDMYWSWEDTEDAWNDQITEIKFHITVKRAYKGEISLSESDTFFPDLPTKTPKDDAAKYFMSEEFSDIYIKCDGDEIKFPGHRFVLCKSPVFAKMFEHDMLESSERVVEIKDISGPIMREFLRFLYIGDVENVQDIAIPLLHVADKYCVDELKTFCEYSLVKHLSMDNVLDMYDIAETFCAKRLKESAKNLLKLNKDRVVKDVEGFKMYAMKYPDLMYDLFKTG